jgi:ketosteroid isomerase-like protein
MKKLVIVFVVLFVSFSVAQSESEMRSKIEALNKELIQAMLADDMAKMMTFYTDDIISLPSYQGSIRGIDAVRKQGDENAKAGWKVKSFTLKTTDIILQGTLAIEIGIYDMDMSGPGVESWPDNGKYLTVWEKQSDGSLKIKVETWNTDNNPWAQMEKEKAK